MFLLLHTVKILILEDKYLQIIGYLHQEINNMRQNRRRNTNIDNQASINLCLCYFVFRCLAYSDDFISLVSYLFFIILY